ncbi:MAG: undecaprenyl-diphosphate phosphatase [Hyphomonadaceae bacterium]|nr:MAG: undecaprenyl-diphosphatase [Caulobacteraceae bacterium]MBT9444273.1 undecaprenyl-diphosphate phosphatase [Hyphomonadaceae bacterium]TPW03520.1 MAG: undecaprenyl-diphosphatase [Alphaproteobacteria bacterium]
MDLAALLKALVLGIVQGLTEFLPISSTAHLKLGERLLGYSDPGGFFTVMIQFGSILAVMWLYRDKIIGTITGLPTKPEARRFALLVTIAFIPALIAGFFAADYVKNVLQESLAVIAWAFIVGGVVMLLIERFRPAPTVQTAEETPLLRALGVGMFQTLALIPGISRSGATIIGGLALGLDRRAAAEFSFFLAMPTMAAAFVHDLMEIQTVSLPPQRLAEIGVGFVAAFFAALLVVKPFLDFVSRAGFGPFAWYRIGLGALLLLLVGLGLV